MPIRPRKPALGLGLLLGMAGLAGPAAAVTFYSDRSAFDAAAPGLPLEDFEEGNVAAAATTACSEWFDSTTSDDCWSPGEIVPHLSVNAGGGGNLTAIFGPGSFGNATIVAGASDPANPVFLSFDAGFEPHAVGMMLLAPVADSQITVDLYDASSILLDSTTVSAGPEGVFLGAVSLDTPVAGVGISSASPQGAFVDDVEFGLYFESDLEISQAPVESPSGTVVVELEVANHGPADATGVAVNDAFPSQLAYVSDDCGGVPGTPWAWHPATIATDDSAVCHVTLSVVTPAGMVNTASVAGDQTDPVPANNSSTQAFATVGSGPSTAETGFALFRSFPDVTIPDETGAPFSFRDHAGQVLVVNLCAQWCGPCQQWSAKLDDLQAALESSIGADNFVLVDLLVERSNGGASRQTDAATWKATFGIPGPVLHAENSKESTLYRLYRDLGLQYDQVPLSGLQIPYLFVLAPDCDNQIALRAQGQLVQQLAEEHPLDLSTVADVAAQVERIWNARRCVRPLVHKLDRCAGENLLGQARILESSTSSDRVEAAESFTVPAGESFDIAAVSAAIDAPDAPSFAVAVYADDGGVPGAEVCSGAALPSTAVDGWQVHRIELPNRCRLGEGDYWLGLRAHGALEDPAPLWLGGVLPRDGEYAFRDILDAFGTGCTDWNPITGCEAGQGTTELCYLLERPPVRVFADGFEGGNGSAWSTSVPPI